MKIQDLSNFESSHIKDKKLTGVYKIYIKNLYPYNKINSCVKWYFINGSRIDCKNERFFLKLLKLKSFI